MAYGNYGAYVWKDGIDMTDTCCDTCWKYCDDNGFRWIKDSEGDILSHALVPLNNILLEFYKTGLKIHWGNPDGTITVETVNTSNDILNKASYNNKEITIVGMELNNRIQMYEIKYNEEYWCVIIGGAVGNGYDNKHVSKLLKKTKYNEELHYYTKLSNEYILDYMDRKDTINEELYSIWHWCLKPMFKRFLHFKFDSFYLDDIKDHLQNIRYLI